MAIWVVSEPGEFDYVSDGFEAIFGIPVEAIRKDPSRLIESIHPEVRERVTAAIQRGEQAFEEVAYENRVVQPDGTVR